jgi:cytochrome c biogenesis protein CcmG, thiol:disulfide interchange protein DsbE
VTRRSSKAGAGAVLAAAVVVALTLAGCGAGSSGVIATGRPVPEISAVALDGPAVSLHALRGRWVVVNFFATWCDPCKAEYPQLVRFANEHKETAQIVGVVYEDRNADAMRFHRNQGGTWPIVADPSAHIASRYRVSALPQSFVIDPQGDLVAHVFGGVTVTNLDTAITAGPR